MFGRIATRKRNIPVIVDAFLDHSTYDKFRDHLAKNGFSESDALVNILERGARSSLDLYREYKWKTQKT